ncbi:N-acetyltransferase eco [Drosophila innubila]|uniref:N-acetyltransferase eco n=1 Tax=Drosophila innubila TaxID=198719 RepID=UPI00148DF800|nr:N-acetyltransferase eco [Drosophila innubila]
METPTGSGRSRRPTRTPTPSLSARKRQLFRSRSSKLDQIDDDSDVEDILLGLTPLKPRHQRENTEVNKQTNVRKLFPKNAVEDVRSILNSSSSSSTNSSPETNKENEKTRRPHVSGVTTTTGSAEQLPHLFTATMRINGNSNIKHNINSPRSTKTREDSNTDTDDNSTNGQRRRAVKREHEEANAAAIVIESSPGTDVDVVTIDSSPGSDMASPECKIRKTEKECIPTFAFYSHAASRTAWHSTAAVTSSARQQGHKQRGVKPKITSPTSRSRQGINKGVRHKIRKPPRPAVPTVLDDILGTLRNEKLRQLITTKREERAKVEQVHEILRSAKDPIKMAKPLSVMTAGDDNNNNNPSTQLDFSDFTDDDDSPNETAASAPVLMDLDEPVIPLIRHADSVHTSPKTDPNNLAKRKFFKSGRRSSTCMEVRITDNIRASVNQGKILLVEAPPKKQRQVRVRSATIFSAEQATVDAILRNLDDTVVDEIVESETVPPEALATPAVEAEAVQQDPYIKYRNQLPYQTDDPEIMEQQSVLLEFLISNNICTDENFEIFIADPENHKDEATRIVDELYMVINADVQDAEVPEHNNLKEKTKSDPVGPHGKLFPIQDAEVPPSNNSIVPTKTDSVEPQGKLFPIFTQRLQRVPEKSTRRKMDVSGRLMAAAAGSNQYQIDAGQKAFGARQCQQCGLVYTVHEPEEEQLHREYHNAVHVLRFKGWIDEDIVAVYPEWGADGRIIRINEHAPAARLQRLTELVQVVDKELGFSSYIVPKTFVAYFAVRKQQIVGLCLVQPLTRANRFIQVDGIDYFSEETFEASCGISRIWVSPMHRRRKIASHLLQAVQLHTILGSEISRDKIAFSAPTDDGRALARHFTQNDNFLAYDQ